MKKLLLIVLLGFAAYLRDSFAQPSSQNNSCELALPFCTGTLYSFPAGVNAGYGQTGPCYNCLVTRPNPAWYYMKVDNAGKYHHLHAQRAIKRY